MKNLSIFHVTSTSDLAKQIADVPQTGPVRFTVLSFADPKMVIYSFVLENVTSQTLAKRIEKEVSELLSLSAKEIIYDYQIFNFSAGKAQGTLACIPKKIFEMYMHVLTGKRFVPARVAPAATVAANAFFEGHKDQAGRICFLNFTPSKIQCAVFSNQQCEQLREIPGENPDAVQRDLVQTLKNICSKSAAKQINAIYYYGNISQKKELCDVMEAQFQTRPQELASFDPMARICDEHQSVSINLSKAYAFSIRTRKTLLRSMNAIIAVLFIVVCYNGVKIILNQNEMKTLKASFDAGAYPRAVQLENMLK